MKNAKPLLLFIFIIVVIISFIIPYYTNHLANADMFTISSKCFAEGFAHIIIPLIIGGAVAGVDKYNGRLNWDKTIIIFASVWLLLELLNLMEVLNLIPK